MLSLGEVQNRLPVLADGFKWRLRPDDGSITVDVIRKSDHFMSTRTYGEANGYCKILRISNLKPGQSLEDGLLNTGKSIYSLGETRMADFIPGAKDRVEEAISSVLPLEDDPTPPEKERPNLKNLDSQEVAALKEKSPIKIAPDGFYYWVSGS